MSGYVSKVSVAFIACHGGPADHFATFIEKLSIPVEVHATGPALKKFEERRITVHHPFSLDNLSSEEEKLLADQIAETCSKASVVMTDVGHPFAIKIQNALTLYAVRRLAYYDNPEPYVPGGYSSTAAEVMQAAQVILFANTHLSSHPTFLNLGVRQRIGIGYYPIQQAQKIAERRTKEKDALQQEFLLKQSITTSSPKLLVYFGGNNEEYFAKAFPAFLSLLEEGSKQADFSHLVIVIQQHPGAKTKNLEKSLLQEWLTKTKELKNAPQIIFSNLTSEEAQVMAEGALYYQTSMGPLFALAKIPTIQIGHETYNDLLVSTN